MRNLIVFVRGLVAGFLGLLITAGVLWTYSSIRYPRTWFAVPRLGFLLPLWAGSLLVFAIGFYLGVRGRVSR